MDAGILGRAALYLGAGRTKSGDAIEYAVGFSDLKKTGELVDAQEPLLKIHARSEEELAAVLPLISKAIRLES